MRSVLFKFTVFLSLISACFAAPPVKVAVIGDSISTGARAANPARCGYPARLGVLLGSGFEVRPFAKSSLCLLRQADLPIAATAEFKAALAWKPDVALVMLGTNDSSEKRGNWKHRADLANDALFIIGSLRKANPKVLVRLLGPPPMFPGKQGLKPDRKADLKQRAPHLEEIRKVFRKVAAAEPGVFYDDLARALTAERTVDGVHPDTFGHDMLANCLRDEFVVPADEGYDVAAKLKEAGAKPDARDFHSFRQYNFMLPGQKEKVSCIVVAPNQAAEGHPWIWRARFFGHQPELDLSLLDRGFHVAFCDVANLYGAPKALDRWDAFYDFATKKLGLAPKPVLEGMSRGGLPIFLWGERHPDRVAAIYGDNPVCDFRSWPGGKHGQFSKGDWQRCLKIYGITEEQAAGFPQLHDPKLLAPLAKAKVPAALVIGTADTVVPPAENGDLLAANYAKLGGPVKVWHKPGKNHHPHGLAPVGPLLRYLLKATGRPSNPAARPVPSCEYRSGAGWGKQTWFQAFGFLKKAVAENPDIEIVFLGDSITQGLTGHENRISDPNGKRVIDRYCGPHKAVALGLSGDRTEHVLWRLAHGQLDGIHPKTIVLMIGINNIITGGHTGEEVAEGTAKIIARLRKNQPQARIVMLGCFPSGKTPDNPRRAEIDALHRAIKPLADGRHVIYRDLRPLFLAPDGQLNKCMRGDSIHVNGAGQKAWFEGIKDLLF